MSSSHSYPYQNAGLAVVDRVEDLVARLSLPEKAGLMFHAMAFPGPLNHEHDLFSGEPTVQQLLDLEVSHINLVGSLDSPREMAAWHNMVQEAALKKRWGIPVTISTDPRHAFNDNPATALGAGPMSQWPELLGMAAIGNVQRMHEFAEIVRKEYLAVGIRMALYPQVDLATEYRWSRISGCLGEDADLTSRLCVAQIQSLQGATFGKTSISTCVKHFPGGGPQKDGFDPHFPWGTEQVYPGSNLEYHLEPFRKAVDAGTRFVMPSYGKPMGTEYQEVGFAFQRPVLTELLRERLGFNGIVLSDWNIISDIRSRLETLGDFGYGKTWGLEHLSPENRMVRAIEAGVDEFGGDSSVDMLISTVESGRVKMERIDQSVSRILAEKFHLGLLNNPFVDPEAAQTVVGCEAHMEKGRQAQTDSVVLLSNQDTLPLARSTKVYLEGFKDAAAVATFAQIVSSPGAGDVAIIRTHTGFEEIGDSPLASMFHHGRLSFSVETEAHVRDIATHCPVVLDIAADRPPVLGAMLDTTAAILLTFGINEDLRALVWAFVTQWTTAFRSSTFRSGGGAKLQ